MPAIVTIATPELGDRSYLVHDGSTGVVVDPQRDVERVLEAAKAAGVEIALVAETHMHNDYVSGGLELSRLTGADYLVAADEDVAFARHPVSPGDEITAGRLTVSARATPGHTPNHLAYVVAEDGVACAVLTGGSMLFGTVGRTDLVSEALTDELTRAQYRSVRGLARELPGDVAVLPTHGFGSFCSSSPPSPSASATIEDERSRNLALVVEDEGEFVSRLLTGLTAYPRYYAAMAPANRQGPAPFPRHPPEAVDPDELRRRIEAGEWVVDLRARRAFARSHLAGTVGFEHSEQFTTYIGWVIPRGKPVTLVGASAEEVARAARDLARIGIDHLAGGAAGDTTRLAGASGVPVAAYPVTDFAGLARAMREEPRPVVLDVRREDEWRAGHVAGAKNIFVVDLPARLAEVPAGTVWTHCASSYRASVAASLLHRAGREVVLVDDDWQNALCSGLPIEA